MISKEKNKAMSTPSVSNPLLAQDLYMFPASLTQQSLWFINQLEPQSAAYNILACLRISTSLDVQALEKSFNALIQRHEILRTTFVEEDGQPMQVITSNLILPLPVIDLSPLPKAEREAKALGLARDEAQRPFDLTQSPLQRILLLHFEAGEHILLLTMHHIISDRWSLGIFFQELAILYKAFSTGQSSPLPDLPIQYADFAEWQRELLQEDFLAENLAYWKQHLAGGPAGLELPTDHPRLLMPTSRGSVYWTKLPKALIDTLKELSRQQGVTLYMTLAAAFQTLLYRYTGQDDLAIGTVTAGRTRAETEALIGFFANTQVLRTDLSGNPSFDELLGRVREVILKAQSHQQLPFEYLVKELHPTRSLGQNPLFQVMLVVEPPLPALPLGWAVTQMEIETGASKFDLTLELEDCPEGLMCHFEYDTHLFNETTIARLAGHWQTLLEGIVVDLTRHLSELPLLTEKEYCQIIVEWNATNTEYPQDTCVHQLFEAQVERTPSAVAVVFEGEQLTYRELNARANQLAHYLQQLGVGPEVLVGICVERSLDMVVGLLGILKAGGAYVPLDPAFPSERLAFMLEDTQAPVLVTQQHLLTQLPPHAAKVVCLDADAAVLAQENEANLVSGATSDNLVYVIYTSGSTGRPKGVQILHRAVVNFLLSMREQPGLSPQDSWLAITTLSFDIAALELFLPLLVGARLIVASRDTAVDGTALAETLSRAGVTVMQATPITWRLLLAAGWQGSPDLKILCGGEALPLDLAQQLLPRATSLWNLYGPTETTIWSTCCQIKPADEVVTIGRPIANTQVYLLDPQLQPVPVGVPGELYIGGDGLARGYLNRPELTAERFLPHSWSSEPGARLYKTGDLARYRPDGTIEHLGRADFQVKIRGFRIELGEIETVLAQHPAVRQAVVVLREDSPGDKHLVAYTVLHKGQMATIAELQQHAMKYLPNYMLPTAFMVLDALPLTPNNKVDRGALPAPEHTRPELGEAFVAPRTSIEGVVTGIWSQILGIEQIGIHDDFFAMGGDSLMAMQVIARLRRVLQIGLPLARFFEARTIAELSKIIEQVKAGDAQLQMQAPQSISGEAHRRKLPAILPAQENGSSRVASAEQRQEDKGLRAAVVVVQAGGSKRPFFFLHGDFVNGASYCFPLARNLGPDQPFYALEPFQFDVLGAPATIEAMAAAHLEPLRSVQPEGPYLLGGFCNGATLAYEMARQLRAEGETVDLLILIDPGLIGHDRLKRRVINRFGKLMRLDQDKQLNWFLWWRYMYRYLKHTYMYLRYPRYRKLKTELDGELAGRKGRVIQTLMSRSGSDVKAELERNANGRRFTLPRLNDLFPDTLFPTVETLRADWEGRFFWIFSEYEPGSYPGTSTFFFSKDAQELGEDVAWCKVAEAKDEEIEVHLLVGHHDTCKTIHLDDLTEQLRVCLNKVRAAEPGRSEAFLR
jgi:amino acid adenylation domain-containing protein